MSERRWPKSTRGEQMGAVAGGIGHDGGIIVEEGLTPMARTPEKMTDLSADKATQCEGQSW